MGRLAEREWYAHALLSEGGKLNLGYTSSQVSGSIKQAVRFKFGTAYVSSQVSDSVKQAVCSKFEAVYKSSQVSDSVKQAVRSKFETIYMSSQVSGSVKQAVHSKLETARSILGRDLGTGEVEITGGHRHVPHEQFRAATQVVGVTIAGFRVTFGTLFHLSGARALAVR